MSSPSPALKLDWHENWLTIRGDHLPGGRIDVNYLEACCRANSHDRDWDETVIPHQTVLQASSVDGGELQLESNLSDGTVLSHGVSADGDEIRFAIRAHNPTDHETEAHWAQPCIRVDRFTGCVDAANRDEYIKRCFIFVDGALARMPTPSWELEARYTPGQTWCPRHVPRADVNPRPLNAEIPSNGLIGCFSADESMILATAWSPYQELFQGVLRCIHADFRIGGLMPGERKDIRGKIYIVPNDVEALLHRYARDFPEHGDAG